VQQPWLLLCSVVGFLIGPEMAEERDRNECTFRYSNCYSYLCCSVSFYGFVRCGIRKVSKMVALSIQNAAKRQQQQKKKYDIHIDPRELGGGLNRIKGKSRRVKGKYIGKERYGGLTKNAPKGKYKGKYIGPDRFKGDAAAYQKYKDEKAAKRKGEIRIQPVGKGKVSPIKSPVKGKIGIQPVGPGLRTPL
jgi:hypothetical protein